MFKQSKITRGAQEGGEGRFARDAAATKDWPGDFFFLRLVTLVIGNLHFVPAATSVRVGASWPILGLLAGRA